VNPDLQLASYFYELPPELIAERPCPDRTQARLLVYDQTRDQVGHHVIGDLPKLLPPQTKIFLNETKVFPCRLRAHKPSGAAVEVFILSLVAVVPGSYQVMLKSSGKKRIGEALILPGDIEAVIEASLPDGLFLLHLPPSLVPDLDLYLAKFGSMPIPPYIRKGVSDEQDLTDYQTSFASAVGSVAAPTAGLHFTPPLMEELKASSHRFHPLTLHVGLGTFRPVKAEILTDHQMHEETYSIDAETWEALNGAGPKLAIGTTALRALESALQTKNFSPGKWHETNLFLYPGKQVRAVDALLTNFHLPESSLLMLVSSLIGRAKTLELYQEAIEKKYRFFSYGDAMLILRKDQSNE